MNADTLFQIRVTGLLIEDGQILLVRQKLSDSRLWSLPGGRLEHGETLEEGMFREMLEETGLVTRVKRLVYLCDKPDADPPLLHITFLLERIGGTISMPTNEFDENPISDVRMIDIDQLSRFGFSALFAELARSNFSDAGNYRGLKANIGL